MHEKRPTAMRQDQRLALNFSQFHQKFSDRSRAKMRVTEIGLKLAAEFLTEGYDAVQGEAPYRIALIRNGQAFCSGNMVNLEWFVTTAACNLRNGYFAFFARLSDIL